MAGGGIVSGFIFPRSGSSLTLIRTKVIGNGAGETAGAILNAGPLILTSSTIKSNIVSEDTGGIVTFGSVLIRGTTISDNHGVFRTGGIFIDGSGRIINSRILDNEGRQGGLLYTPDSGSLVVSNTLIKGNDLGIYNYSGSIRPS